LALPTTTSLVELFNHTDIDAIMNLMGKMAIEKALETKLSTVREAVVNKCVHILRTYRSALGAQTSSTQIVLPDALKHFPLFILALIKNVMFRTSKDISPDVRSYFLALFRTLPTPLSTPFMYPRLYSLHTMSPECGLTTEGGGVIYPPKLNLSSDRLDRQGAFLLDDGQKLILWLGKNTASNFCSSVFGIPSLQGTDTSQLRITQNDDPQSLPNRIINLIESIRSQRPLYQKLHICKEGDLTDALFFSYFIEDQGKNLYSYSQFLTKMTEAVNAGK